MHAMIHKNDLEQVLFLLKLHGHSALATAISSPAMVSALLEHGAHPDVEALIYASSRCQIDSMRIILDKGGNVNGIVNQMTALTAAIMTGCCNGVTFLLERGADVNVELHTDDEDFSPLICATRALKVDMVQLLVKHGAIDDGETELLWAIEEGHDAIALALTRVARDLVIPMTTAAFHGRLTVVRALIDRGVDVNGLSVDGETALMLAVDRGHEDVVFALLDHGADINMKSRDDGWTPLMYAAAHGYRRILRRLLYDGADLEAVNVSGDTALTIAMVENGGEHGWVVKRLRATALKLRVKTLWRRLRICLWTGARFIRIMRNVNETRYAPGGRGYVECLDEFEALVAGCKKHG